MKHTVIRPGDEMPDHDGMQATAQISSVVQGLAAELMASLVPLLGDQEALNAVWSGLLSALINVGIKSGSRESTARNLMWSAVQVAPQQSPNRDYQLTTRFVALANVLMEIDGAPRKELAAAMLNAAANAAFEDRDWLIAQLRQTADRMSDPAELAAAEARAAMATRPADASIQ